jgi:hypothetical protein
VVWIDLPAAARINDFDVEILEFFGLSGAGPTRDLTHRAVRALHRHGTRLLIVDDAKLLKTDWKGGREVLDHVKSINTKLGQGAGATPIFIGADLEDSALVNDPQVAGRLTLRSIKPFRADSLAEQTVWQRIVFDLEAQVLPHLPAGKPGMLYLKQAGELWFRTQGYLGDLTQMVSEATLTASIDGTHRIAAEHLKAVRLSKRAEDGSVAEARRRRGEGATGPKDTRKQTDPGTPDINEVAQ